MSHVYHITYYNTFSLETGSNTNIFSMIYNTHWFRYNLYPFSPFHTFHTRKTTLTGNEPIIDLYFVNNNNTYISLYFKQSEHWCSGWKLHLGTDMQRILLIITQYAPSELMSPSTPSWHMLLTHAVRQLCYTAVCIYVVPIYVLQYTCIYIYLYYGSIHPFFYLNPKSTP